MKPINWSRAVFATVVAYVAGFIAYPLLFGNPIVRGIIYTPGAGQSEKLLAVWLTMEPLPVLNPWWNEFFVMSGRKAAAAGLLLLWMFGLVLIYAVIAEALPGQGWRKGLSFGVMLWAIAFPFFEVFFPFNLLGEPFKIILLELALEVVLTQVWGLSIAALYRAPGGVGASA